MLSADARRAKRRKKKKRKKKKLNPAQLNSNRLVRAVIILVGVIISLILLDGLAHAGRIHSGVKIQGLPAGLLTEKQVEQSVVPKISKFINRSVEIKCEEKSWIIYPSDYELKIDAKRTAAKAFGATRNGSLLEQLKARFSSYFSPLEVGAVYSFSKPALQKLLSEIISEVSEPPTDAGIVIEDTEIKIISPQTGLGVQRAKAQRAILKALLSLNARKVNLSVERDVPDILEAEAERAQKEAEWLMQGTARMEYGQYHWDIKPSRIGRFIEAKKMRVSTVGGRKKWILKVTLSREKVYGYLGTTIRHINIPAQDAQFKVVGTKIEIRPSQEGFEVDKGLAYLSLRWAAERPFFHRFLIIRKKVEPKLTTEEAKSMGIEELISSYTTYYSPGDASRVNNIHLLGDSLNNELVAPGEVFSFNRAVGPRTAQKGYQEAPVILKGELVPAIGGGVCQVGTTIFNAVFFGGYPVLERHNHSFYISHYPAGRDATVSYPAPDFKFKNDTSSYLLIKVWYTDSSITISIYGRDVGSKVSYETTPFTNSKSFPIKKVKDSQLPEGKQVIEDKGITGRDVTVYRIVRRGGKIIRRDRFFSRYRPKIQVVRVGTKKVEEKKKVTPETTSPAR